MEKISSFIDYNMWDDTRSAALRLYIGGFGQLQSMWDVTCDHFPAITLRHDYELKPTPLVLFVEPKHNRTRRIPWGY